MRPEAIFVPMSVLALWTLAVLFVLGARRVTGTLAGRISRGAFSVGPGVDVPTAVTITNRNYMNLLEAPLLFYVVSVAFYVTHQLDAVALTLAWIFVALRFGHSLIHLGHNNVIHRLIAFATSNLVLLALWVLLLVRVV